LRESLVAVAWFRPLRLSSHGDRGVSAVRVDDTACSAS
jgi:hypothetical protein